MINETKILNRWRKQEQLRKSSAMALMILSVLIIVLATVLKFTGIYPMVALLVLFAVALLILFLLKPWLVTDETIARQLDLHYPELEESTALLYKDPQSLNLLENLQVHKTSSALKNIKDPFPVLAAIKKPLIYCSGALVLSMLIWKMPGIGDHAIEKTQTVNSLSRDYPDIIPPEIVSSSVIIAPPAYTRRQVRRLKDQLSFEIEEGGHATWQFNTKGVESLKLFWNDKLAFTFSQKEQHQFTATKNFTTSGFYQLELDGKRSDIYAVEVIKDMPPSAKLSTPSANITIDFGQPRRINISGFANDDHGIVAAQLFTTIATGQGEGVQFREQNFSLPRPGGSAVYNFSKLIQLDALQMAPGDEIYFFVEVKDAKGQLARTEAQTVTLKDTTELMSVTGFSTGVNLMPEYFRSQRQIIMDTEKLLKDKPSLTDEEFKARSNNIGIDQKLLRLRYGKFLGEENEETIGSHDVHDGEDHEGHDHAEATVAENFNDQEAIMAEITHMHDRAEDATFFDAKTKTQLKNTLTEMWKAELQLRTFKPQQALPFEYKALVLLKDLQQKDRAYVAKTTYTTPALAYEKRMTGELNNTISPVWQNKNAVSNRKNELKAAAGVIQNILPARSLTPEEQRQVALASSALMEGASQSPGKYLIGVRAARNILNAGKASSGQIAELGSALRMMIGVEPLPQKPQSRQTGGLGRAYFENLKTANP